MTQGVYERKAKTAAFPCSYGCGKRFKQKGNATKGCAACRRIPSQVRRAEVQKLVTDRLSELEAEVVRLQEKNARLQEEVETLKTTKVSRSEFAELRKLITGRGTYNKKPKPTAGFCEFTAQLVLEAIPRAVTFFKGCGATPLGNNILRLSITLFIAHVLSFMSGHRRVISFGTYPKDCNNMPVYCDLYTAGRTRKGANFQNTVGKLLTGGMWPCSSEVRNALDTEGLSWTKTMFEENSTTLTSPWDDAMLHFVDRCAFRKSKKDMTVSEQFRFEIVEHLATKKLILELSQELQSNPESIIYGNWQEFLGEDDIDTWSWDKLDYHLEILSFPPPFESQWETMGQVPRIRQHYQDLFEKETVPAEQQAEFWSRLG